MSLENLGNREVVMRALDMLIKAMREPHRRGLLMMKHWKDVAIAKIRGKATKRDRGYYTRKFTLSELRQMLGEAENRSTRDMYERFVWKPQIIRYTPGDWERHLINAANVAV